MTCAALPEFLPKYKRFIMSNKPFEVKILIKDPDTQNQIELRLSKKYQIAIVKKRPFSEKTSINPTIKTERRDQ